jgi:UDP-N-acetylmuramyl pentapeptide phosphotransferase/UDP-N-acetylglucosamine-1-phosphate transferase
VLLSLGISLGLCRVMLVVAPGLGLMDEPGERRIHSKAVPRAGGIAIWLTFLLVIGAGLATGLLKESGHLSWSWFSAFAAGSAVLMAAGFLDDRSGLRPLVKLAAHALAPTVFFVIHPIQTGLFPAGLSPGYDYMVFVIWVVVLINAFNLIDGLDGLCGGLAAVSAFSLSAIAMMHGRTDAAMLLLVMGGAVLGFLKYKINPARIFLGDAGSMLMGFFLATAATDAVGRKAVVGIIMLPIAVAGVPLLDVLLAIWRRGARRRLRQLLGEKVAGGIFDADSDHLHHRLLAAGASQRKVAGILQMVAIALALLAFLPMVFGGQMFGLSLVGFLIVGLVGLRNLARIEIEHTGSVVHLAIKRPGHPRRVAATLFVYDLLVLVATGCAAVFIETNRLTRGGWDELAPFVMIFAILGSLALWIVRVHQRLWVRATMRDIISLQFWLLLAAIGSFTLFSMVYQTLEWSALRLTVMSFVFACAGVCVPRASLNLIRELGLDARHRNPNLAAAGRYGPLVVMGAGDLGTLLLDHLKSSSHDIYPGMRVLGFIDETPTLHGRRLRSFRILGGLSVVPSLVRESGLKGIILAINRPGKELLDQLEILAGQYHLRIYRWNVGLEDAELSEVVPSSIVGTRVTSMAKGREFEVAEAM